ncbi:MAG: hypothetical protein E7412_00150 [Ruminococcaceae bacterium]|nr:hypothetical protein [Oscillospiraceae bacterium]
MMWIASDNAGKKYNVSVNNDVFVVKRSDIPENLEYIDLVNEALFAKTGENGYYVIADFDKKGSRLCFFNDKPDDERILKQDLMPLFGVKKDGSCALVIVEGFKYEFSLVFGVKNGEYYIYPRFFLNGNVPYEDICIKLITLENDATYSDMAVAYRNYQLGKGVCLPLSEKIKERKALAYAIAAPEIRIRMGWKPAPPTVLEQTLENEPEMKVACTFDRVCDLIDEMKAQGIDKAQLCLVGWNKSGHDGRWPQIFPVEEKLGGEKGLRHLISYAQKNGYQIVCHTNSTDCYSIADTFSEDIVVKNEDGSIGMNDFGWSGGRPYDLCPVKALAYAKSYLPKVRELGFEGLHYIDVLTVVPLRWCYDKNHPVNSKETLEMYHKIMALCHELFGGFSSEGCFDFGAEYLDYGLYVSRPVVEDVMADKVVPFWQIAYHGIMLYNSTTDTVNYPIKDVKNHLLVLEDGTRPSFYIYSKFLEGSDNDDWLGKEDLIIDTDEQLRFSVSKIKEAYEEYKTIKHLQTEFILEHKEVEENIFAVTYSDGTKVIVDYNTLSYKIR